MSNSTATFDDDRVTVTTGDLVTVFRRGDDIAAANQISSLQYEIERLKRENADLKTEVDRLKRERTHWYLTCAKEKERQEGAKP